MNSIHTSSMILCPSFFIIHFIHCFYFFSLPPMNIFFKYWIIRSDLKFVSVLYVLVANETRYHTEEIVIHQSKRGQHHSLRHRIERKREKRKSKTKRERWRWRERESHMTTSLETSCFSCWTWSVKLGKGHRVQVFPCTDAELDSNRSKVE